MFAGLIVVVAVVMVVVMIGVIVALVEWLVFQVLNVVSMQCLF